MKLTSLDYKKTRNLNNLNALVLSGGGALGISYCGALEAFDEELKKHGNKIFYDKIKIFAGSSAGAITAMMLGLSCPIKKVREYIGDAIATQELEKVVHWLPQDWPLHGVKFCEYVRGVLKDPTGYPLKHVGETAYVGTNIFGSNSIIVKTYAIDFLEKLIQKTGHHRDITFGQLKEYYGDDSDRFLGITVCDIGTNQVIYITTENEKFKDIRVVDAVYASMSIPFIFQSIDLFHRGSNCVVDGGTIDNYPIAALPDEVIKKQSWIGFILSTKDQVIGEHYYPITDLFSYLLNLLGTLMATKYKEIFTGHQENIDGTVFIDTQGCNMLDFDMDINQATLLMTLGSNAVRKYFDPNAPDC